MGNVMIFDHPLIQHKIGLIRNENTGHKLFRELVSEIAVLMAYEVTKELQLADVKIKTPLCETTVKKMCDDKICIVPVLRAGLGMVNGLLTLLPNAKVGHIGLYRDHETMEPVPYYCNLPPDIDSNLVIVLDPMLATGGSGIAAINSLKEKGAAHIKFMCLIASEKGIEAMKKAHPDVDIYAAACDEKMNDKAYIVPGLGDAGDRLYATK